MAVNGYFEFRNSSERLELLLHPASGGGRDVKIEDVIRCLEKFKIETDNIVSVSKQLKGLEKDVIIPLGSAVTPFSPWIDYSVSDDAHIVTAVLYPGFAGAKTPDKTEIMSDLAYLNVTYGIMEDAVDKLSSPNAFLFPIVVAKGVMPVEGRDAVLTYKFDVEKKAKPSIKEDGTVDYRNLDGINHVTAGDVVAEIIPEDKGTPGCNVYGIQVAPVKVKRAVFKYGRNLQVSEDGLSLISLVNGHVTLEGNKIFVSNVLEVVDVDNSTGNIEYDGDVVVTGNVLAGFSVKATGNIEIRGVVEGARIEAGGDVTLVRGVQGMNKAEIICGGNMVTKFIESVENISVEGSLETDTILHSKVTAKGYITAQGRNGLIIGGDVRSIQGIEAKTIGNTMGTATVVGAGVDPALKKEIDKLKKDIVTANDNKNKLDIIVTRLRKKQEMGGQLESNQLEMLQQTTRNMIMIEQEIRNMRSRLEEIEQLVTDDLNARIKVHKSIFPGTKLVFGDIYMFLKDRGDHCQYAKRGADIKSLPL